jgi:hypothetical protein
LGLQGDRNSSSKNMTDEVWKGGKEGKIEMGLITYVKKNTTVKRY